jgi:TetR/AcrR family transcriptional repressor of nem operon
MRTHFLPARIEWRESQVQYSLKPARCHRTTVSDGCLSGEIRNAPEVKGRFTANLKEIISAMVGERREAMATLATLVGAISLARAVEDEAFSREILREVQKKLDGEMAG